MVGFASLVPVHEMANCGISQKDDVPDLSTEFAVLAVLIIGSTILQPRIIMKMIRQMFQLNSLW